MNRAHPLGDVNFSLIFDFFQIEDVPVKVHYALVDKKYASTRNYYDDKYVSHINDHACMHTMPC